MKKRIAWILASVVAVSVISGCAGSSTTSQGTQANTATQSAPADTATDTEPASEPASEPAAEEAAPSGGEIELKIPTYRTGQNVGAKFFLPQVERFNAKHAGQYKVVVEEIPQDSYNEKIKQLAQVGMLPPFVETAESDWFLKVAIPNNMMYDLSGWMSSNPDIANLMIDDSVEYNTIDGKVVSIPLIKASPIGMYYNSTMYNPPKPIGDMTLEEFAESLGDNKIAFMTSENAWTVSLLYTAMIAAQPGGVELLQNNVVDKLYDFNDPIWINATAQLQEFLQKYASSNTLGAAYADAANSFMSKNSAIIPNGSWMASDFDEAESADKWSNGFSGNDVKVSIYPGNFAVANVQGFNGWIPSNMSDELTQGALAFITFINSQEEMELHMLAEGGLCPKMEYSEGFLAEQGKNRILNEYALAVKPDTIFVPRGSDVMPASVQDPEFGKLLPKLIDGSFTPEQFCQELTNKAKEAQ